MKKAEFDTSSLEAKILLLLMEVYPITSAEITDYLKSKRQKVDRALKKLAGLGLILLEPLAEKTFVTLVSGNFRLKGQKTEQLKDVEEKLKKRKRGKTEYDGMMFG